LKKFDKNKLFGKISFLEKSLAKRLKVCDAGRIKKFFTDLGFCQAFFQKA